MPNKGGRYEIRDGKRTRVEHTKPAPQPSVTTLTDKPTGNSKPGKSTSVTKGSDNV